MAMFMKPSDAATCSKFRTRFITLINFVMPHFRTFPQVRKWKSDDF